MTQTEPRKRGERGRPRLVTSERPDLSAAEQILDAAARLFVERGYAATSTRAIAELVGIRQASLYYHFPSKDVILRVLLLRTVEPSMSVARRLAALETNAPSRLWALIAFDTRQLLAVPHNVGTLYLLPETRSDLFENFRTERRLLREVYESLILQSVSPAVATRLGTADTYLVDVVFGLVESVIATRADRPAADPTTLVRVIAESALGALGYSGTDLAAIATHGESLLDDLSRER